MDKVLKAVGDLGSTAAARVRDVRRFGLLERALICRDSLGLLGGLAGLVGVDIAGEGGSENCSVGTKADTKNKSRQESLGPGKTE